MPLGRRHLHGRDGLFVLLARSNAEDLLDRHHEDLAVADFSRPRALQHGPDRGFDEVVGHADLEAHLVGELHLHRRAAIGLHVFALAAVPLHAADGETLHFGLVELLEYCSDPVGPDNGYHQFHARPPSAAATAVAPIFVSAVGSTRMAASPSAYASSPCWLTSMPRPSSLPSARSGSTSPTSFSSTKLPTPL